MKKSISRLVAHSQRSRAPSLVRRSFHTTVNHRQDPRPPNGTPLDPSNTLNHTAEEQRQAEADHAKTNQVNDTQQTDDAKSAAEARKFGGRKRLRRPQDVPKPPPLPAWFLKHNVKLVDDHTPVGREGNRRVVRCVDEETGHTLFTVPYHRTDEDPERSRSIPISEDFAAVTATSEKAQTAGAEDESIAQEHTRQERALPAAPDHTDPLPGTGLSDVRFFDHSVVGTENVEKDGVRSEVTNPGVDDANHDRTPDERHKGDTGTKALEQVPENTEGKLYKSTGNFAEDLKRDVTGPEAMHPRDYAFLMAELSIRAGLSLLNPSPSSSFAATRVDLALSCRDSEKHDNMDIFVENLAGIVHADLIRLDANDFEELTNEYVSQGDDAPGSFTNLAYDAFHGYDAIRPAPESSPVIEQEEVEEDEAEEEDEDDTANSAPDGKSPLADLRKMLFEKRHELSKALSSASLSGPGGNLPVIVLGARSDGGRNSSSVSKASPAPKQPGSDFFQWDDARLGALLDSLLDAPEIKRASEGGTFERRMPLIVDEKHKPEVHSHPDPLVQLWDADMQRSWFQAVGQNILNYADDWRPQYRLPAKMEGSDVTLPEADAEVIPSGKRTIVHIRDLRDIGRTKSGDALIRRLVRSVVRRRKSGENVLIVGTTAREGDVFDYPRTAPEDAPFRSLTIAPSTSDISMAEMSKHSNGARLTWRPRGYRRILEINVRHIQSMLRRIRPESDLDFFTPQAKVQLQILNTQGLSQRVLAFDAVQRLVLMAIGLSTSPHAKSDNVTLAHIIIATFLSARKDRVFRQWIEARKKSLIMAYSAKSEGVGSDIKGKEEKGTRGKVEKIRKSCNAHETRLLTGVVDAQNIRTGFNDVHVQPETIEALKTLTSLSLVRPEAFKYGVLATDRLPGLLLYGPPGTGKTLLAKAVAKESKATVMEVSGAQIYEKYVGEGEKMVRAVFSLAKKLSPCVVFIDEADAIFGSRGNSGSRNTHREIINQFLREWDGLNDAGCFIMVATNRPFDLDDAVLRRLPRRLLVDLPVAKDRESILKIHLKEEAVDPAVSLADLAEHTPLYSGSDLKNLCVSAALACVREENDLLTKHDDDPDFKLPEKRTLQSRHFETATAEISASISEDMSSLVAIRKFDEKYGDRKGRRKKSGYGFGAGEGEVDESAARVRQTASFAPTSPSSPPPL